MKTQTLSPHLLRAMGGYGRAANYLSVGRLFLYRNPLLRESLQLAHVKPLVVGHWGTTPGQNFIYVHLNSEALLQRSLLRPPGAVHDLWLALRALNLAEQSSAARSQP